MTNTEPTTCNACHKVHVIHCDNCECIPCLDAAHLRRHAERIVEAETSAHAAGTVTPFMQTAIDLLTLKLTEHVPHFGNLKGQDHDDCLSEAAASVIATLPLGTCRSVRIAVCIGLMSDDTLKLIDVYSDAIMYAVANRIV